MQLSQNPDVVHGFETSRRKVVESLTNLSFARIVSIVQLPNKIDPMEPHFQGEVEEVFASKHKMHVKHAFFSRFSRNTQGVSVLGCFSLVDTPIGTSHASALPQLGDVLVGSFVEAGRKGKLPFEFKGWCNNGKPLLEFLRVLQFGTRMSAKELHTLLRQPASITAAFVLRLNSKSMSTPQLRHANLASQCVDDIWNIARALCFKELSPDDSLKLSKPHWEMMTQLAMNTLDEDFLEKLNEIKPEEEGANSSMQDVQQSMGYGLDSQFGSNPNFQHYSGQQRFQSTTLPTSSDFGSKTPEYTLPNTTYSKTPPYSSSSPPYAPSSPPQSKSPPYIPESPPYISGSPPQSNSPPKISSSPFIGQGQEERKKEKEFHYQVQEEGEIEIPPKMPPFPIIPSSSSNVNALNLNEAAAASCNETSKDPVQKKRKRKEVQNLEENPKPKDKVSTKNKKIELKEPILYSPSQQEIPAQILYSPSFSTVQESPIPVSKGKLILGNLLAKINSSPLISYEEI